MTPSSEPGSRPVRTVLILLGNAVSLNLLLALAWGLSSLLSWHWGVALAVVGSLAVVVLSIVNLVWSLSWTALVALPACVLVSFAANEHASLRRLPILRDVRVADVPRLGDAAGYVFADGSVQVHLRGYHQRVSESSTRSPDVVTDHYAAPVVGDTWHEGEEVTVWAVCMNKGCDATWDLPFRAAMRAPMTQAEGAAAAVEDAVVKHGLRSHPRAVRVLWVASPEEAIDAYRRDAFEVAAVFNGVWWVGFLGWAVWRVVRRARAASSATGA